MVLFVVFGGKLERASGAPAVFGTVAAFAMLRPDSIVLGSKVKIWVVALFAANAALAMLSPLTRVGVAGRAWHRGGPGVRICHQAQGGRKDSPAVLAELRVRVLRYPSAASRCFAVRHFEFRDYESATPQG